MKNMMEMANGIFGCIWLLGMCVRDVRVNGRLRVVGQPWQEFNVLI